ncbi:Abi family protein [Microbacterium binotii]|uniref:Abi family protein n=1 Tax=Microbacterium binotii TaxID=462710 RepID=UPI001F213966|nr:Abi family protein [Microbacterium binotii]UIN30526.1 Abi family protein [Microbacterium binotii]
MKDWINLAAQVQKHRDRGLQLDGVSEKKFGLFLYSSNYYRVSGYARCFYEPGEDRYASGATASRLMDVYDLDRAVRNAVLDGVSVVEPTLRARVAYHVAGAVGGDGHLAASLYLPDSFPDPTDERAMGQHAAETKNRNTVLAAFEELRTRSELFIRHHIEKEETVPLWAAIEVLSIGTFSRMLRALRDKSVLEPVAKSLAFEDIPKLLQAVQNIAFIRNIAAHHGRLWNRKFTGYVTLPSIAMKVKRDFLHPQTPAAALTLLAGMVDQIEGSNAYSTHLLDLVHSVTGLEVGYYQPTL